MLLLLLLAMFGMQKGNFCYLHDNHWPGSSVCHNCSFVFALDCLRPSCSSCYLHLPLLAAWPPGYLQPTLLLQLRTARNGERWRGCRWYGCTAAAPSMLMIIVVQYLWGDRKSFHSRVRASERERVPVASCKLQVVGCIRIKLNCILRNKWN